MCSCDQSLVTQSFLWEKLSQPQFYKNLTRKTTFFEEWSWFKFNNLGLALGTNLKFYTSVAKGLKPKAKRFWGLIPTFVEVTGEKLVWGLGFLPPSPHSWIGLKGDLEVVYKICVGRNSYCYDYCLLYLIWTGNNAMRPLVYHPPHIFDNADTVYLGNQHWQWAVLFFYIFLLFLCSSFAYVSVTLWVSESLSNPSQVFKNLLL